MLLQLRISDEDGLEFTAKRGGERPLAFASDFEAGVGEELAGVLREATLVGQSYAEHVGAKMGTKTAAARPETRRAAALHSASAKELRDAPHPDDALWAASMMMMVMLGGCDVHAATLAARGGVVNARRGERALPCSVFL